MNTRSQEASREPHAKPFNLGYLVPEFPTQTHNFFWKEIAALRLQGIKVALFSTRIPDPTASPHPFREEAIRETTYLFPPSIPQAIGFTLLHPARIAKGIRYIRSLSEASFGEKIRLMALLPSAIALLNSCKKNEIVHIHCHSCANAAHLVNICNQLGGPNFSLTLHGDMLVYGRDHLQKMASAQFVACVTSPLQNDVINLTGKPPEQVPMIRMGVDTGIFIPGPPRETHLKQLTLVTVARLNPSKGIDHALNALFRAKQQGYVMTYLVAGEGPDRPRLEKLIATLNLADSVRLLGTTGEKEVIALLQNADAFVLPSTGLGEAAPVSVMEAMACGLPVVCSHIGGTPDMISDGVEGFLTPQRDEKALLEVFTLLADDPVLRTTLGKNARARAVREFDYIAMAQQLLLHIQSGGE